MSEDGGWNLLESLPQVPLRIVSRMLSKEDKKNLRLVSRGWRKVVWYLDAKFRLWFLKEADINEVDLVTLVNSRPIL
jgi:hypothetical protein